MQGQAASRFCRLEHTTHPNSLPHMCACITAIAMKAAAQLCRSTLLPINKGSDRSSVPLFIATLDTPTPAYPAVHT